MNFDFSDDQKMLRDQARKFLAEKCTNKVVRRVFEGEHGHDSALWKGVAEMGWLGTAIPENYGGLGLGYLELCVVAEELGRVLAPVPFSSTVYLFAEALLAAGTEDQKTKLLPKIAEGKLIGTFARAEGVGAVTPKSSARASRAASFRAKKSRWSTAWMPITRSCSRAPPTSRANAALRSRWSISKRRRYAPRGRLDRSVAQACGDPVRRRIRGSDRQARRRLVDH